MLFPGHFKYRIIIASLLVSLCCAMHAQIQEKVVNLNGPSAGVIQKAIVAMGGEAWASVGAATMKATITYAKGPTNSITQSDDWTNARIQHRIDTVNSDKTRTTIAGSLNSMTMTGSKTVSSPASYDLSRLAHVNPAAALRLALNRRCYFRPLMGMEMSNGTQKGAISMECKALEHMGGHVAFLWWFNDAGLPTQVQVPMNGMLSRDGYDEVVQYESFQSFQGLSIPSKLQVTNNRRLIYTETISDASFQASLSSTLFSFGSQAR